LARQIRLNLTLWYLLFMMMAANSIMDRGIMKHFKIFTCAFLMVCAAVFFTKPLKADQSFAIAAVVNEDAISVSDVEDRMRLIIASAGLQDTQEIRQRVMPQALNSLLEEQIQIQEADRNNLTVTQEEIEKGFAAIASQNQMTPNQFESILASQRIPKSTLERQIKAQVAWSKVLAEVLRPQINVTQTDIDARMDRLRENFGRSEYLVSEIFLPVDSSSEESSTRELAQRLIQEIKNNQAPFEVIAAQFSKAAGADQGGSLGWIQEGTLSEELDKTITNLDAGEVSAPVRSLSGYHILYLRQKRTLTEDNLPSRDDMANQIGFEKLDRLQARHLQDLKSESFIERRV